MIIKKIQVENYVCYYSTKTFEFSQGLNIILGANGEGKTNFFEAVDWLLNGENRDLEMLVCKRKLHETEIGESFRVRVSMEVEQYGENSLITKSFLARKENPNECSTSSYLIEGVSENNSGERSQVDGQVLLDRIFPFEIRKYSMFKGEAELNIFDNDSALASLINLFSEAKHYDKYSEKGAFLREKAEQAVDASSKADKKNEAKYKSLESEILKLERDKNHINILLKTTEDEIQRIEENLQDAERHVTKADALETLDARIKNLENQRLHLNSVIDENYTTALFDENWILLNFEPFHKEFSDKIAQHSKRRRELQSEYDKQKGIKEGEKKAKAELLNNAIPLPIGTPSKSHMEEMLNDEICKVCNREAKKGTDAYQFMMKRLKAYLKSQEVAKDELDKDEPLFKFNYTNRLENLSISHEDNLKNLRLMRTKISEIFEFNDERKRDIEELNKKIEQEISEKHKILGKSNLGAEKLIDVLKNYNSWQKDLKDSNKNQIEYAEKLKKIEAELILKKEEKDKIDTSSANSFLIKTRNILRDIEAIFLDTKENKFNEFVEKLQSKSNNFFKTINVDAFTGTIVFTRKNKINRTVLEVELQEDGRTFYKPNQSLLTSMHIAILFAISELAAEIKQENFPLIFDAPISSFDENKKSEFLNLIYSTGNQKILLIKDFVSINRSSKELEINQDFNKVRRDKAFWVRLERPFDEKDLKTINSQVIPI
jgi:DNA sulfur modification protein DndD